MEIETNVFGGINGDFEVLTLNGWISSDAVNVNDEIAQWDPTTSVTSFGALNCKTVEDKRLLDCVDVSGLYSTQNLVADQPVWCEKLVRAEEGHEPRWVLEQRNASALDDKVNVFVSGFHYGQGLSISLDEVAVAGMLWAGLAQATEYDIVVTVPRSDTDRSVRIIKTLQRLAVSHPNLCLDEHDSLVLSGELYERIMQFFVAVSDGGREAFQLLWEMNLVEKETFVWAAIHCQENEIMRRGWLASAKNQSAGLWLQTLCSFTGLKSCAYESGRGWFVGVQQERVFVPFASHRKTEEVVTHLSVPAGVFYVRQHDTIFLVSNS